MLGRDKIKFGLRKIRLAAECRKIRGGGDRSWAAVQTLRLSGGRSMAGTGTGSQVWDKGSGRKMWQSWTLPTCLSEVCKLVKERKARLLPLSRSEGRAGCGAGEADKELSMEPEHRGSRDRAGEGASSES